MTAQESTDLQLIGGERFNVEAILRQIDAEAKECYGGFRTGVELVARLVRAQQAEIERLRAECYHWERMARTPAEGDPLEAAIEILRDIAAMGKKAGSETAKNWLIKRGYPLEEGGYVPGKGYEA